MSGGLIWLPSCGSTNDEALARLDDPTVEAVATDHQTAGRGRRGRRWHSPAGAGLYLTWIARPRLAPADGGALPLLTAVAVAETCEALGAQPRLKWPNDLLLNGGKLAGILCEARGAGDRWQAAVGVGLNLRTPPDGWPPEVPGVALDTVLPGEPGLSGEPGLAGEPGLPESRAIAEDLLTRLRTWLARVEAEGWPPLLDAWHARGLPPGTRMQQGDRSGAFEGLEPDGALRLRAEDGAAIIIRTGEVALITGLNNPEET